MSVKRFMPDASKLKEEILEKYPTKVAKKRGKGIVINDPEQPKEIQANIRSIPGIITQRGCCYAGCKGVVLGPTRDIINIVHGPIGCSYYAWLTRRNQTRPETLEDENFITYCFSTDMQEDHVVFGGEKKLAKAVDEAYELFHPKAIAIHSTCPVGLIGDDIHAVAKKATAKFGDCNVFAFSCEGYKGVSQSAGHHIANNGLFKHVIGRDNTEREGKYKINLLGEYNIGGDSFELERLFEECGITLVSTYSGNSTYSDFENSHMVDLNLVMCHRSINYVAEMMEDKYGVPWIKVNFIGAESTAKSLRKIAEYFEDADMIQKVNEVCERELSKVKLSLEVAKPKTDGKLAMLFVGGSRAHHYQDLFKELGMKTVAAGYEFAHRDDYEGREVIPNIKIDADSKNIEELKVTQDPELYKKRLTDEDVDEMKEKGIEFADYKGMMPDMDHQTFVIDDITHYETHKLIEAFKPDVFCAGIKEKYVIQKMGVPLKQLHSYDYGGPYAGFEGAVNFYKDISRMVSSRAWKLVKAPWQKEKETTPEITATYVA